MPEEEAEEFEGLEPDHLAVGAEHLEDGPHATLQFNTIKTKFKNVSFRLSELVLLPEKRSRNL